MGKECPFCEIIAGRWVADELLELTGATSFRPLRPVTEGHLLVVPNRHAERLELLPEIDCARLLIAVRRVGGQLGLDYNVIQSNGEAATQTVGHVHFHVVPRRPGDGLKLPWSPG